eukprot:11219338-Alexandrium_andersonii.AAC.1
MPAWRPPCRTLSRSPPGRPSARRGRGGSARSTTRSLVRCRAAKSPWRPRQGPSQGTSSISQAGSPSERASRH